MSESSSIDVSDLLEQIQELQSEEDQTSLYSWIAFALAVLFPSGYLAYKSIKHSKCSSKCCGNTFDIQFSATSPKTPPPANKNINPMTEP